MNSRRISEIEIGERVRKDMGNLDELAHSIQKNGLLHPVVITRDSRLVCGARRIEAVKLLGWEEITVNEMDIEDLLSAEHDENAVRKDFLPSEAVAIGRMIETRLRITPSERSKRGWASRRNGDANSKLKSAATTHVVAAKAVGMSGGAYQHAKEVVRAAEEEPQIYGDLPAQMDSLGSVYPVHKEMKRRQNGERPSSVIPRTKTFKSNRTMAQRARHAIGVIVSMSSDFDNFKADEIEPTPQESKAWEKELAGVISSLNRFRREIKRRRKT